MLPDQWVRTSCLYLMSKKSELIRLTSADHVVDLAIKCRRIQACRHSMSAVSIWSVAAKSTRVRMLSWLVSFEIEQYFFKKLLVKEHRKHGGSAKMFWANQSRPSLLRRRNKRQG